MGLRDTEVPRNDIRKLRAATVPTTTPPPPLERGLSESSLTLADLGLWVHSCGDQARMQRAGPFQGGRGLSEFNSCHPRGACQWHCGERLALLPPLLFFFWPYCTACRILVPQPGIEPGPSAVKVWSPNHWTARNSFLPPLRGSWNY